MKRDLYRFAKARRDKEYYTLLSWNDKYFNNKEILLMKGLNEIFQEWNDKLNK